MEHNITAPVIREATADDAEEMISYLNIRCRSLQKLVVCEQCIQRRDRYAEMFG